MNESGFDKVELERFRKLPMIRRILRARARLLAVIAFGLLTLAFLSLTTELRLATRLLIAWDFTVALYLTVAFVVIFRSGIVHIRRNAVIQDEGRFVILTVIAGAAFASLGAIIAELGAPQRGAYELILATATIALSWTMIHVVFALHYAHEYYRSAKGGGLNFPDDDKPDYWDFIYFSFVIGMTAQVSDVGITDKTIRRTATAHGVVSFFFNTALLALMVNIAASAL
jgi:uncharacterized membrane protein